MGFLRNIEVMDTAMVMATVMAMVTVMATETKVTVVNTEGMKT